MSLMTLRVRTFTSVLGGPITTSPGSTSRTRTKLATVEPSGLDDVDLVLVRRLGQAPALVQVVVHVPVLLPHHGRGVAHAPHHQHRGGRLRDLDLVPLPQFDMDTGAISVPQRLNVALTERQNP